MPSKRRHEGYIEIDHTNSPGLTLEQLGGRGIAVGKGQRYESATVTCCHCQRIVILNPLRTRERHYCQKCDEYVCDWCAPFPCRPFVRVIEQTIEGAIKRIQRGMQRIGW